MKTHKHSAPLLLLRRETNVAKTMAEVLAEHTFTTDDTCACTCDEMFYDWRRTPEEVQIEHRLHVEMQLHNAGFGLVADAKAEAHKLKSVRGELKSLGRNLDSWESEGHTTATIRFLRQWISRATKAAS